MPEVKMNQLKILVAEDLESDVFILKRAFARAGVTASLHFVKDGADTIDYLKGEGVFANRAQHPLPSMLLLDLNMPKLGGFDVLEWLRLQPGLKRMPTIVFTSSNLPEDVNRAYDLGANSYLVKPPRYDQFEETARSLESYWFKFNQPPYYADPASAQPTP